MSELVWEAVTKTWPDGTAAVRNVTVGVASGEFVVITGPSGCGKTTLLRLAAGLEFPTNGRIRLGGRDVTDVSPSRRGVAMVFQGHALYPNKTIFENLAFGLRMRGEPKKEIAECVNRMAERLALTPLLTRLPHELSGGQQQRVGLGRALIRSPSVLLLDEPLSSLDAGLRRDLRREIKALQRETRATAVHVTHDQDEALALADRLIVMRDGVVQQIGRPDEVYTRPANRFVAGFIGDPPMNFLAGHISDDGACWQSHIDQIMVRLPTDGPLRRHAGRSITLGVRAESLREAGESSDGRGLRLIGRVVLIEQCGSSNDVMVRLDSGTTVTTRLRTGETRSESSPVELFADEASLHWFASDEDESSLY